MKRFLIKHVGNMGDLVFFIPPVLAALKKQFPGCHITLVTAWGYKEKSPWPISRRSHGEGWGNRNQGGFSITLMMTNPDVDQLIHWHDTKLSLAGDICVEEGKHFPTWNRRYFEQQKNSGRYDGVFELDFGLRVLDNPISRMYQEIGLPLDSGTNYRIYLTERDRQVAAAVMADAPRPRIVLLESMSGTTTRGWDPGKVQQLAQRITQTYQVEPLWFGSRHVPFYQGRQLTLRENIATLTFCQLAVGVMSGPAHFTAAVGLPTLTLYCDQPLHRAAPAYFLNPYLKLSSQHRTLLGPTTKPMKFLKSDLPPSPLTHQEIKQQQYKNWTRPGRQATKSCLAAITVDEVMLVLQDMLTKRAARQT